MTEGMEWLPCPCLRSEGMEIPCHCHRSPMKEESRCQGLQTNEDWRRQWRGGKRGEGKIWPPPSLLYSPLPSLIIPSLQRVRERGDEWTVRKWTVTTEGRDRCVWPLCASIPLFAAIRTERSEGWGRWPDGRERRWESGEWNVILPFPSLCLSSPLSISCQDSSNRWRGRIRQRKEWEETWHAIPFLSCLSLSSISRKWMNGERDDKERKGIERKGMERWGCTWGPDRREQGKGHLTHPSLPIFPISSPNWRVMEGEDIDGKEGSHSSLSCRSSFPAV